MTLLVLVPSEIEAARISLPNREGVDVLMCGVGMLKAALSTAERLRQGDVERCLLVGLGGSRDYRRMPLGTLAVGTAVRDQAFGVGHGRAFLGLDEMSLPPGDFSPPLLELEDPGVPGAVPCVIASVAAASATVSQATTWRRRHPDALVEEMEGYGVALACRKAGVPLSILRAISNVAGDRDKANWQLTASFRVLDTALVAFLSNYGGP
jgi:futalosine hydrolase